MREGRGDGGRHAALHGGRGLGERRLRERRLRIAVAGTCLRVGARTLGDVAQRETTRVVGGGGVLRAAAEEGLVVARVLQEIGALLRVGKLAGETGGLERNALRGVGTRVHVGLRRHRGLLRRHHGLLRSHHRLALRRRVGVIATMETEVDAVDAVFVVAHPASLGMSVGERGRQDSS